MSQDASHYPTGKKVAIMLLSLWTWAASAGLVQGDQTLVSQKVATPPKIDGLADDPVWDKAPAITTHDRIANIDITLKSVYTDQEIFFLVRFPDEDESRTHKTWIWNSKTKLYDVGPDREDIFVFKWNMGSEPVDLSIYADNPHKADIWFWKAQRSDPAGFADDKVDILSLKQLRDSKEMTSKSGRTLYLQRLWDAGEGACSNEIPAQFQGERTPRFKARLPSGSRADIKAKGVWRAGEWTLEFARRLNTGHDDDVQFDPSREYQFGVSRYEIAGRKPEPSLSQPLYGCGDVGESLTLQFSK